MTKRYDEPIEVTPGWAGDGSAPIAFRWRGRRYLVDQHLASWRTAEPWNGKRTAREYHRVLAHPAGAAATGELDADGFLAARGAGLGGPQDEIGAVYDVCLDGKQDRWRLVRVWD